MTAKSPTARSKARYSRAHAVLPKITLNAAEAAALLQIQSITSEQRAALIRRLLIEESNRVETI